MTDKPLNVRIAVPGDEEDIFNLLCLLYKENALFTLSRERAMQTFRKATHGQGGIIGLIETDKGLVGSVGLYLEQYWYTDDYHLSEYYNFTHPDHRKSGYAQDLIDFAKWCNENMSVMLMMGIISNVQTLAKIRMYSKKLKLIGAFFTNDAPNLLGRDGERKINKYLMGV